MDLVTMQAKRKAYSDLRSKALSITDAALNEQRELTDGEAKQLGELVEQAKAAHADIERGRLGDQGAELLKSLHDVASRPESWPGQTGIKAGPTARLAPASSTRGQRRCSRRPAVARLVRRA